MPLLYTFFNPWYLKLRFVSNTFWTKIPKSSHCGRPDLYNSLIPVLQNYNLRFFRSSDQASLPISHHEPEIRWPGLTIRNMNELASSRVLPFGGGPPPPTGSNLQPTESTLPPMIVPCRWCQTTNPGDCQDGFCDSMWNKENLMRPIHIWLHSSSTNYILQGF